MPIVVDAKVRATEATKQLNKLKNTVDAINKAVQDLNMSLLQTGSYAHNAAMQMQSMPRAARSASRKAPSGTGGNLPARPSGPPKPPKAPPLQDPLQGMRYWAHAAASGNPHAVKQYLASSRAFSALQRGQHHAQGFLSGGGNADAATLVQALLRTRFVQHGAKMVGMPLGVDIASLLSRGQGSAVMKLFNGGLGAGRGAGAAMAAGGLGAGTAALAAVAAAAGMAGAAIAALAGAASQAKEVLARWASTYVSGGGTPGEARMASRIEDALGLGPGGAARVAMSYGQGTGPIAAAQAGISPLQGGLAGNIDFNRTLIKTFDYIQTRFEKSERGFAEARRWAITQGTPELAKGALMSREVANLVRASNGSNTSYKQLQLGQDFETLMNVVSTSIHSIVVAVGTPVLKAAAKVITNIANAVSKVNWEDAPLVRVLNAMASVPQRIIEIYKAIQAFIDRLYHAVPEKVSKALGWNDPHKALRDNTDAVDANTRALKEGIYGGGSRASQEARMKLRPQQPGYSDVAWGVL